MSRIGTPLTEPLLRTVKIGTICGRTGKGEKRIKAILDRHLEGIGELVGEFVAQEGCGSS